MESVYLLWHVHKISADQEDEKLIGVYRTEQDAREAIVRAQRRPGFKDSPDEFLVDTYELNKDHWVEGFAVVR